MLAGAAALVLLACEPLDGLSGGARTGDTGPNGDAGSDGAAVPPSDASATTDAGEGPFVRADGCRDGWCFLNPKPLGYTLRAVWAIDFDHFYAVGERGTFLRYRSGVLDTLQTGVVSDLNDVRGTSASEMWAVGENPSAILHLSGGVLSSKAPPTAADLTRVRVQSEREIWIARRNGAPYRSSGDSFVPTPDATTRGWSVLGLAVAGDVGLAVGVLGFAAKWDGTQWTDAPAPYLVAPSVAAYAAAANDIWTCIAADAGSARWNGSAFTPIDLKYRCRDVDGTGASSVWLVGSGMTHWNGNGLVPRDTPLRRVELLGVSAVSGDRAIAVGPGGTILRWDGSSWGRIGDGAVAALNIEGYRANASVLGRDELWVTGRSAAVRWDGAAWSVPPAIPLDARGCWLRAKNDIVCAAAGGIVRYNGTWVRVLETPFVEMTDVDGVGSVAWAVGGGGRISRWNGTTWADETSGTTARLRAVWARSDSDVFAFGDGGVALRRVSGAWTPQTSVTGNVIALEHRDGRAIVRTDAGQVLRFDGTSFVTFGGPSIAFDWIALGDGGVVWVGGAAGLARFDGSTWSVEPPPPLRTAWGAVVDDVLWVGDEFGAVMAKR